MYIIQIPDIDPAINKPPPRPPPVRDCCFVFFQKLREETETLEAKRDALQAEAAAKLSQRTLELEALRSRAADLSSKLEVCARMVGL